MSNKSVLVFISSIQDKNMLTVQRLSQIRLSLKSAPSGCSWAMNGMFCCGQTVIWSSGACWITPEAAFLFQGKRGFKHEHAGEVTVGTTCIRNLPIWSFRSEKGGAVDGLIWAGPSITADLLRTDGWKEDALYQRLRSDGCQQENKSTNSLLSQATHVNTHSPRQSGASGDDCAAFPHFSYRLSDEFFLYWSVNCGLLIEISRGWGFLSVSWESRSKFTLKTKEEPSLWCNWRMFLLAVALRLFGIVGNFVGASNKQAMKKRCLGNSHPPKHPHQALWSALTIMVPIQWEL